MTHLYLIRHGQMDGIKPGINGSVVPNSGLSPMGIAQAEALRDRLAVSGEIRADVLISSPLRRAKETADMIAPALGLPVLVDDEMQEFNLGSTEGLTLGEITERFGFFEPDKEPFRRVCPDGDSVAEFRVRAWRGIDRILREYDGKTIVIVCHGGIIEVVFMYILDLPMLKQVPLILGTYNTAITHLHKDYRNDYGRRELHWFLKQYNDYAHLRDLEAKV
ncbi:MAG TPA: histidine phosphatase family protein [Ktedonosporobacter sp.]|nr:histidine phosphatase family protein [Ktedonosporobacter sp.]